MKICLAGCLELLACAAVGCQGAQDSPAAQSSDAAPARDAGVGVVFPVVAHPIVIATAGRTPRTTTGSVNYWKWTPTGGNDVAGTEALVGALAPAILRVGGHGNDTNTPDPFDTARLDEAIAYARAVGAEPLVQVPLVQGVDGRPPTAATAAAMVTYANVTRAYGVKYFSVGNEPDEYASQGAPSQPDRAAIPNYEPADYCASARAYVTAMKAVDPTIQIVGPDLAWRYLSSTDWLSPILQGCGDLFDVVSVHRYPFSAGAATLDKAAADPAAFRAVIGSIRDLMQLAGYGQKPLALTEMNIANDSTPPGTLPAAAPGTVPAALWLADVLGSSMELQLWTSAVWAIGDPDDGSLGIIGPAPQSTPRPAYYAYKLYADHFGPTLVNVTTTQLGVSAHASRNRADDTTDAVIVNWNVSSVGVDLQVTGLAEAPPSPVFVLPPLSVSAVEIPDHGAAAAWTYGDAQHIAGVGPQPLAPAAGDVAFEDGGVSVDASDAGFVPPSFCPGIAPTSPVITVLGSGEGVALTFGPDSNMWGSFTYAASGQSLPAISVTPDGDGMHVVAQLSTATPDANYSGFGLYYSSPNCLDASHYQGLAFDFSGSLGGCMLAAGVQSSADVSSDNDPIRGSCPSLATCYGPSAPVSPGVGATIRVPFGVLAGGMPVDALDSRSIISLTWQLTAPAVSADGGPCNADFAIENATFY